jgi:Asp/Glu/hydantoin racemase
MRIWHQSFSDLDRAPVYRATLREHAARVVDPGTAVTVHGLRPGTYGPDLAPIDAIRFRYIEFLNESQVCEAALAAERAGYDAFALGCFFDPALRQARSLVDIPVVGLSESCMLLACSLGKSFGLVALNRDQQVRHEELAVEYGLERRLAGATAMEPPIDEYMLEADVAATAPIAAGFERACRRLLDAGAEVVIPGDGFLNEFVWRRRIAEVDGAPVMDALGALFRHAAFMAGARARLGLGVSRRGHYARPPAAMLEQARARAGVAALGEEEFSGRARPSGQQP